jgi:hypothetical protein
MPVFAWIIAQTIEAQGDKKSVAALMLVYYAGLLGQSPTSFSDHASAASRCPGIGLVPAWVHRGRSLGAPYRRIDLDGLQPIIDTLHRATDLGLGVWRVKEPLDLSRDFRL